MRLTKEDRAILLAPCVCGHTINDHGSLATCWTCDDDGHDPCAHTFEDLLVERQDRIVAEHVSKALAVHRDLTSRLGFGDDVTEPMADNDTIVKWYEEQSRDANEWRESQMWRNDCYVKGHSQDDDCRECDPWFAVERALAPIREAMTGDAHNPSIRPSVVLNESELRTHYEAVRAALAAARDQIGDES